MSLQIKFKCGFKLLVFWNNKQETVHRLQEARVLCDRLKAGIRPVKEIVHKGTDERH